MQNIIKRVWTKYRSLRLVWQIAIGFFAFCIVISPFSGKNHENTRKAAAPGVEAAASKRDTKTAPTTAAPTTAVPTTAVPTTTKPPKVTTTKPPKVTTTKPPKVTTPKPPKPSASAEVACRHFRNIADDISDALLTDSEILSKFREVHDDAKLADEASIRDAGLALAQTMIVSESADEVMADMVVMSNACQALGI